MKITHDIRATTIIKVTALTMLTRIAIRLAVFAAFGGAVYWLNHINQ